MYLFTILKQSTYVDHSLEIMWLPLAKNKQSHSNSQTLLHGTRVCGFEIYRVLNILFFLGSPPDIFSFKIHIFYDSTHRLMRFLEKMLRLFSKMF